jgi:phosphohistidine swiveling domain-containing protein
MENRGAITMLTKRLEDIQDTDLPLVGGKGLNLGLLMRAGFRVPDGFCVTTHAYRIVEQAASPFRPTAPRLPPSFRVAELPRNIADEIFDAYSHLGSERVAVRSSATAEDLPDASFAGQQDTFLNVRGEQELLKAIMGCWVSLWSERAMTYRQQKGIDDDRVSMAIVVQRMLDPASSGVMFSVSPGDERQLMIEASWGLGEAIVSGEVTPDSFTVDRRSLQIVDRIISPKKTMITESGELEVPEEKRKIPSLNHKQIVQLARLGLEIEDFYSSPQDIEWAMVGDEFYILQSRPITTSRTGCQPVVHRREGVGARHASPLQDQELEQLRNSEIKKLREMAEGSGTVWCSFNLSETLPAPLPMTWAIISKFMSGRGGFGLTYRDMGFIPSREVDEKGVVDLICGRAYFNLSREARLYFDEFPFEHNFEKLKENPANASYPQPTVNIRRSTAKFWLKFPYYVYKMIAADRRMKRIRKDYDSKLKTEIIPEYCRYIEEQRKIQMSDLSDGDIMSKMDEWVSKTLRDFAKDALKASVLAGMSYSNLQTALIKCFGQDGRNMLEGLIVGLEGDLTVDTNQKLWEVAHGQLTVQEFLEGYGHRAVGELELAQPRWREDTGRYYVESMVNMYLEHEEFDPGAQFLSQKERREKAEADLRERLSVGKAKAYRKNILREAQYAQRYLPYRETAKFYLMMGYELIRNALLELGRRYFDSAEDIFYLTPDELPQLIARRGEPCVRPSLLRKGGEGVAPFHRDIAERKRKRSRLLSIELPDVIFSDSLHEIGHPSPPKPFQETESFPLEKATRKFPPSKKASDLPTPHLEKRSNSLTPPLERGLGGFLKGTPVSGGVASGQAKVLLNLPQRAEDMGAGHILVCPSTDPGWAPLFPGARGLVMERGGVLSHGAIIAREYGIPAVANIPGATRLIKDGQRIKVDGNSGEVFLIYPAVSR